MGSALWREDVSLRGLRNASAFFDTRNDAGGTAKLLSGVRGSIGAVVVKPCAAQTLRAAAACRLQKESSEVLVCIDVYAGRDVGAGVQDGRDVYSKKSARVIAHHRLRAAEAAKKETPRLSPQMRNSSFNINRHHNAIFES